MEENKQSVTLNGNYGSEGAVDAINSNVPDNLKEFYPKFGVGSYKKEYGMNADTQDYVDLSIYTSPIFIYRPQIVTNPYKIRDSVDSLEIRYLRIKPGSGSPDDLEPGKAYKLVVELASADGKDDFLPTTLLPLKTLNLPPGPNDIEKEIKLEKSDGIYKAEISDFNASIKSVIWIATNTTFGDQKASIHYTYNVYIKGERPPIITEITPDKAKIGDTVTITGQYFNPAPGSNTINFYNSSNVNVFSANVSTVSSDGTQLTFIIPQNANIGVYNLKVRTCDIECLESNSKNFEVIGYGSVIAASCDINLNPLNGVFANGYDTAEITILNIRDAQGLFVPDGSFLVFEPLYRSNYSDMGGFQDESAISPYYPTPYPARTYDGRKVAGKISDGIVKVTYQAPTAGLEFRNPSGIRGINVYAGQPDWHGYIGPVNLILSYNVPVVYTAGAGSVTVSPQNVPICNIQWQSDVSVSVSGIVDANGEIVPDGTPIRVDGGINGLIGNDSKRDRYLTSGGSVTATCRITPCTEGASCLGIWSTITNYYWGDKLKVIGAWCVTVVK